MRKNCLHKIIGMLLAIGILGSGIVMHQLAQALDREKTCTLTIAAGSEEQIADLQQVSVVVDAYLIAEMIPDIGYDSYSFAALPAYNELDFHAGLTDAGQWRMLAQQAMEMTFKGDMQPKPTAVLTMGEKSQALSPGLYLLAAHREKETQDTYWDSKTKATVVYSDTNCYRYMPELIALPNKAKGINSNEAWQYDVEARLKPEQTPRKGSVNIIKKLDGYHTGKGKTTCVFRVVGAYQGEVVYSDVLSIDFTASGTGQLVIDDLPIGTEVTAEEIYSGASYQLVSGASESVIVPAEGSATIYFENEYRDTPNAGYGITNTFCYEDWTDEQGNHTGWHWIRPDGIDALPKKR